MQILGLGLMRKDAELGWYFSEPIPVSVLDGRACRIVLAGYEEDSDPREFDAAVQNFISVAPSVMRAAEQDVFAYYCAVRDAGGLEVPSISAPADVWGHVNFGSQAVITRRAYGDRAIYVSLECECDWEPEHGMQIVLRNGLKVVKVGPYDGHCTNSDAYDDDALENVVFVRW